MLNPSRSHMVEMPQVVGILANVDLEHEARYIHCGSHYSERIKRSDRLPCYCTHYANSLELEHLT